MKNQHCFRMGNGQKIKELFTDKLWMIETDDESPLFRRFVRVLKLMKVTIDTFMEHRMGFQCVALSYFITLAAIPFMALLFAITDGFGLSNRLTEILHKQIKINPDLFEGNMDVVDNLMEKANNIIDVAKSGGVGIISALFFLFTILWMMFQVERVFNNVWGILKIPRNIFKRIGFYFLFLAISPFMVLVFGSGIAFYSDFSNLLGLNLGDISFFLEILGNLIFFIITALTFSAMYKFIPATKVKYEYALKSAVISGIVFVIFQHLYLDTQMFVGRLNRVYGVLAAVPLFLIWLNFSWQIIIYGAQLTYSYHMVDLVHPSKKAKSKKK